MTGFSAHQIAALQALGIEIYQPVAAGRTAPDGAGDDPGVLLGALERQVAVCEKCELHRHRTQTVFGVGNPRARWMFVGEAPGAEEDRQGLPFVGRAGQLLTAMIAALGMARDDVYIANVLKCRPPDNRDPLGDEVTQCEPYLHDQLALIRPAIIVALGKFAAQSLLKTHEPISRLRGRIHHYGSERIPLVPTYHPAYLLRSPLEKRKVWQDLVLACSVLQEVDPDGRRC